MTWLRYATGYLNIELVERFFINDSEDDRSEIYAKIGNDCILVSTHPTKEDAENELRNKLNFPNKNTYFQFCKSCIFNQENGCMTSFLPMIEPKGDSFFCHKYRPK
jgi:hypothetical protein